MVLGRQQAMVIQVLLVLAHCDQQVYCRPCRLRWRVQLQGICQVHDQHLHIVDTQVLQTRPSLSDWTQCRC